MNRSAQFELLCRCLRPQVTPEERNALLTGIEKAAAHWPQLVALASELMVSPALYSGFVRWNLLDALPADVTDYFEGLHRLNSERNDRIAAQLLEVARTLNAAEIEPIFLKGGAHLLSGLYAAAGDRFIRDIDILVAESELDRAAQALEGCGYAFATPRTPETNEHKHLPILKHSDRPVGIELHRRLVDLKHVALSPADVIRDSATLKLEGLRVRIPSLPHRILHHVLHTQLIHRNQLSRRISLRLLLELEPLVRRFAAGYASRHLLALFAKSGQPDLFRSYFYFAHRLLGMPVPAEVTACQNARFAFWQFRLLQRQPKLAGVILATGHLASMGTRFLGDAEYRRRWSRRIFDRRYYASIPRTVGNVLSAGTD